MDVDEFNSRVYFENIQLDTWTRFDSIPAGKFKNVWDYIDQPELRPCINVYINAEFTMFIKKWKYER